MNLTKEQSPDFFQEENQQSVCITTCMQTLFDVMTMNHPECDNNICALELCKNFSTDVESYCRESRYNFVHVKALPLQRI